MADPLPYTVSYSFAGFQANSPTTPLPAPKVDTELANIATAVAGLIAAIQSIRRSDGALQNNIVTFESFESGLQLLLDPTNGQLVAAAVATTDANAALTDADRIAAAASAAAALTQANNAAASASSVNLTLYLAKANNLAGLGSLVTSRANLGLGTAAVLDVGNTANKIVQLDGAGLLPALDGSQLTNVDVLPVGSIFWVAATAALAGTLKLNGALISRASFPRLFTHANASGNIVSEASWSGGNSGSYSTGDLSTTFRLPDARGEFIRGYDDARGIDTGRVIGARQVDLFKSHTHSSAVGDGVTAGSFAVSVSVGSFAVNNLTGATGGAETRPRNIPLLACVKY